METGDRDTDQTLFEQAMAGVNRHHRNYHSKKVEDSDTKSIPVKIAIRKTSIEVAELQAIAIDQTDRGENVLFARAGLQKKQIRRLQRGEIPYEDVLDLHGMTSRQAEEMLDNFVGQACLAKSKCILVIHGKGYRSENRQGVLKPLTVHWLKESSLIQAFCSTLPRDGGTGAVYVLLKKLKT